MPTPDSVFDAIEYESWMGDIDQGEMFLNYPVDPHLLKYLGVDVTEIVKDTVFYNGKKESVVQVDALAHGGASITLCHHEDVLTLIGADIWQPTGSQ